ncbi:MAG: hypothetical protein D6696_16590 [Acidobacteria bacterium]|nr:MAG: hypothetical protein D6696_16590 [Acidobacteriota bacterium]
MNGAAPAALPSGTRRRGWRRAFAVAAGLCLVALVLERSLAVPAAVWRTAYGALAALLVVLAALLGLRRRAPRLASRWRLGSARAWLALHVYGGLLFLLLLLMHSGFRLPQGALGAWLWGLSLWTAGSGALGLVLERWIPRLLTSGLSVEVLYERIPELADELRRRAEERVASCGDAVQALYARRLAPAMAAPRHRLAFYLDVTGGIERRLRSLDYLRRLLPAAERRQLEELAALYRSKLELDAHYTLQRALRLWLYVHLPPSLALVALVAVHVAGVIYY